MGRRTAATGRHGRGSGIRAAAASGAPPAVIWIVSPPGYSHSRCFEELALALREAFAALGSPVPVVDDPRHARGPLLVLGTNLLRHARGPLPRDLVLYNLEQVTDDSGWIDDGYVDLLQRHPVWDYSRRNIALLRQRGVAARWCGVGYVPALTRIRRADAPDLDVVFVGSMNERRFRVLERLQKAGKRVVHAFDCYGRERDALYARARVVLNLHYYDAQVFEIVRVSYLLANRLCVVSETGRDESLEAPLAGGVAFATYDALVDTCLSLLADDDARARVAEAGFARFSALSQVEMLRRALAPPAGGLP